MNSHEFNECDRLEDYAFDEMSTEQRQSFERHLDSCESCRVELKELRGTWDELGYLADEVEPPVELKGQVMSAIFGEPAVVRHSRWLYWSSAAVIVAIIAGTILNFRIWDGRQSADDGILPLLPETANIEKLVSLESLVVELDQAYGVACILNKGVQSELVVYLFGAKRNEGTDAYQVWLLKDDERTNAGTFKVGDQGIGVLTFAVEDSGSFESIGITLEPDGKGDQPRGPKVFASADRLNWN